MYGAIYGDLVGYKYETDKNFQEDKEYRKQVSLNEPLINDKSIIGPTTISTIAIKDGVIKECAYDYILRSYILEYQDLFYEKVVNLAKTNMSGKLTDTSAAARISSIPLTSNTYMYMLNEVNNATIPTHNSQMAISASVCVATIMYMVIAGYKKEKINEMINKFFPYEYNYNMDKMVESLKYTPVRCDEVMPILLNIVFSVDNLEEALRKTLLIGGKVGANCAIVSSLFEIMHGKNIIDTELVEAKIPAKSLMLLK